RIPLGQPVVCLSGLGRPGELARTAAGAGLQVVRELRYPDHHRFTARELARAMHAAAGARAWVLVSRKDACRLAPADRARVHVLDIAWEPTRGGDELASLAERAARGERVGA